MGNSFPEGDLSGCYAIFFSAHICVYFKETIGQKLELELGWGKWKRNDMS